MILIYIAFLNFEDLGKSKLISFQNRFKRKKTKDENHEEFGELEIEEQKTEAELSSGVAF